MLLTFGVGIVRERFKVLKIHNISLTLFLIKSINYLKAVWQKLIK